LWSDFESDVVEGRYPVGRLVRSEGRCGWFETRFEDKAAIISLIESLNDEAMLLERLRVAEKVSNQNVAAIFEAGATALRATPLVYAVMEHTEENLEDVLRARALSADETKELAESLLNALQAIHRERLVCGRLEAASVLAAGDTIKLRTDSLQLVPEDVGFEPYVGKDIRDLGSLLHQCLTQKPLNRATDSNDPSLQLLPPPFVQVVRRTLSGQATIDELAELLRPGAVPVAAAVEPKPAPSPAARVETVKVSPAPVVAAERPLEPKPSRKMPLIVGGVTVLLVLALFGLRVILHHSDHAQDATAQNPVVVVSPETAAPRTPAAAAPPQAKTKASAVPVAAPSGPAAVASPSGSWRIVAFTYNYQEQAEHKARTINEKHPDLQASVFSPKGSGAPFLVTLGAATDRASAFRLRDKAVAEGLPRDTYAQNYSH